MRIRVGNTEAKRVTVYVLSQRKRIDVLHRQTLGISNSNFDQQLQITSSSAKVLMKQPTTINSNGAAGDK